MEGHLERRGLFDGLKVPQGFNAVFIATVGLFVYWLGVRGIEEGFHVPGTTSCRLLGGVIGNGLSWLGHPGQVLGRWVGIDAAWTHYPALVLATFGAWSAVVWAFLACAVSRLAALELARDEGLELREALVFGARRAPSVLGTVAFVLIIVGFFYLVTNASIAGGVGRLGWFGGVLVALLFGLVLITSFFVVLALLLGLFGLNLAAASIATEVADAFEGVSRAWDYVLSRPWNVLLVNGAVLAYLCVVFVGGQGLLELSVRSLSVGAWGLGAGTRTVELDDEARAALKVPSTLGVVYLPGRADFVYGRVIGREYRPDEQGRVYVRQGIELALERYREDVGDYPAALRDLVAAPDLTEARRVKPEARWTGPYLTGPLPRDEHGHELGYRTPGRDGGVSYDLFSVGAKPDDPADDRLGLRFVAVGQGPTLDIAPAVEGSTAFLARGVSIWVNLGRVLLYGYMIAYFFGAQTTLYFLLRKEVEGEDYTEVVLEEDLEDEEAALEPAASAPSGGPAPAAGPTGEPPAA